MNEQPLDDRAIVGKAMGGKAIGGKSQNGKTIGKTIGKKHVWLLIPAVLALSLAIFFVIMKPGSNQFGTNDQNNQNVQNVQNGQNETDKLETSSVIDYTEAPRHIGEELVVKGTVHRVTTTKGGVTFLDFCDSSSVCPFSVVIFASDLKSFPNVKQYVRSVEISGVIRSYKGKAEIILEDPKQIHML